MPVGTEYPAATLEESGVGAVLFDSELRRLYEVMQERRRTIKAGARTVSVVERRLVDLSAPVCEDERVGGRLVERWGEWFPMADVLRLRCVRPVRAEVV